MVAEVEVLTPCIRNSRGDYSQNPAILEKLRAYYVNTARLSTDIPDELFGTFACAYASYKAPMSPYAQWSPYVVQAYELYTKSGFLPDYVIRSYELLVEKKAIQ